MQCVHGVSNDMWSTGNESGREEIKLKIRKINKRIEKVKIESGKNGGKCMVRQWILVSFIQIKN